MDAERRLAEIEGKLDLILAAVAPQLNTVTLNKAQFLKLIGISNNTLIKYWLRDQINFPCPYRVNRVNPVFTMNDVQKAKKRLGEMHERRTVE